ncbi:YeaH/YhbH family protein [Achromobacter sp. LC458]|uniref:YeaH/YhbH family protein n=1 Tax=unclassified Achromobacter TaxID=2626865 RepID=UPI00062A3181|nr:MULTISPECIES: YeaH/YhbH family protein [unclassified Achromobacter]MDX3987844.1 YeaH/YhbH family protein [Achromobacter sp.]QYJ22229.1 YeaH/YhbH family protein [Achromobacter sp. ES-001]TRM51404.1 YeaH/YhbH family protein [Achromobacter sp. LC458]HCQ45730.1 YeaH/YhbH family protein [Achromobacter sp.]
MNSLIDRRLNGRNKSAVNRERFLRRYKDQIRKAVHGMIRDRSIQDMDQGGEINLPARDISEPTFRHGSGGDREMVHPGNREFAKGDTIDRPQGGQGEGGSEPGEGESVDQFTFSLSRAEFLNLFFEDLELPHLARNQLGEVSQKKWQRAGYTTTGSPSMLSISRTLKSSLARRVSLNVKARADLEDAEKALADARAAGAPAATIRTLEQDVEDCRERLARVPFLDDLDLRYRNRVSVAIPMARAVMFCLMDVSGSMDEGKKDLAKRFFTLLYLFLSRKYEHVDLVFIRHTDNAEEVDEQTFFYDPKSGGTIVLSALELMREILEKRYPPSAWNVYAAQASDGDSFGADAGKSARFLAEHLLPSTRYFAYIEIPDSQEARKSSLWAEYEQKLEPHFVMRRICDRGEIFPVFHDLFKKETA